MIRLTCVAFAIILTCGQPAAAQTQGEVEAARDLFINGDQVAALAILLPAAEAGNAMAQNTVGTAYAEGLGGLPVDPGRALDYFERSAAQGYGRAYVNLGSFHQLGLRTGDPDLPLARASFDTAFDLGATEAAGMLGLMWLEGEGGPQSAPRGLALLQFGAARGDRFATYILGLVHYHGQYVPQNLALARDLIAKAAAQGEVGAMLSLGIMLQAGEGGPADPAGAMREFRAAIALGDLDAAMQASAMILADYNAYPDFVEALVLCWWARDRATGDTAADYARRCEETETHFNFLGIRAAEQRLLEMRQAENN